MSKEYTVTLEDRIREAVASGDYQFWEQIYADFPEIKTHDFKPEEVSKFKRAMEDAVVNFINHNKPDNMPIYHNLERFIKECPPVLEAQTQKINNILDIIQQSPHSKYKVQAEEQMKSLIATHSKLIDIIHALIKQS